MLIGCKSDEEAECTLNRTLNRTTRWRELKPLGFLFTISPLINSLSCDKKRIFKVDFFVDKIKITTFFLRLNWENFISLIEAVFSKIATNRQKTLMC